MTSVSSEADVRCCIVIFGCRPIPDQSDCLHRGPRGRQAELGPPRVTARIQRNAHAPRPSAPGTGSATGILMSTSHGGSARTALTVTLVPTAVSTAKFRANCCLSATCRPIRRAFALTHTSTWRQNPPCKRLLVVSYIGYHPYLFETEHSKTNNTRSCHDY